MQVTRKITVRVDPDTHRALKVHSAKSGEAVQQMLLRLIRDELRRDSRRLRMEGVKQT
jgi:predicted HicB family RNase H-like nuclease